jgi:hypothetical protein
MDTVVARLLEQINLLREEATAARAEAAARDATLREELAAARAEAAARDAAARADSAARDAALRAIIGGKGETPLSPSYATVGDGALAALAAGKRIFSARVPPEGAPDAESAPVATPGDLGVLLACASERDLVAAITPLLRAARGFDAEGAAATDPCSRVLVNSERTPWLDALHAPLPADQLKRPDLFSTWAPFWSGRQDPERGAVGKLAARALQLDGCVCEIYEAKRGDGELTAADFGQLVDYHSRVRGTVRGMLFNARVFWLYESVFAHAVSLTQCEWGARGSRAALRAFFDGAPEPPLVPLLRFLCGKLGVAPRRVSASGAEPDGAARASAFLGAGGSARVFCVARLAGTGEAGLLALKASTELSVAHLSYEFDILARAATAGAPVVPVVAGSLAFFFDAAGAYRGGGFLLRDVCARAVLDSQARFAAAFAALRALHLAGFAHGDARTPNLLARGSAAGAELVWIDLRAATTSALESAQRADGRTLAASMLGVQPGALPAPIDEALAAVPGGDEAYAALAAAVWTAAGCLEPEKG